jgi:hypothetical protein
MIRITAITNRAYVWTGPVEPVHFGNNYPAAVAIKTQVALYIGWHFQGVGLVVWRAVRHRRDDDLGPALGLDTGDDNHDGAVLQSFLLPLRGLACPEIGIGKDVTRFGYRPAVARRLWTAPRARQ